MREDVVQIANTWNFLLNVSPAFMYYICYLIVLFLWAGMEQKILKKISVLKILFPNFLEIYHTTNKQDLKDPSVLF